MAFNSLRSSVTLVFLGLALVSTFGSSWAADTLPGDAPVTVPKKLVESSIKCIDPPEWKNKPGGVILLIHGTLCNSDYWVHYMKLLPTLTLKHEVCTITLPDYSLSDVQVASEYVAYAIEFLSQQSATKKVKLIAHSQGGLNAQWALTFWPSLRSKVETFIALAPDFAGTTAASISSKRNCPMSYAQQSPNSKFLQALNSDQDVNSGASALVSTFSIFSDLDDIVESSSSHMFGAKLIPVQSFCGSSYNLTHIPMAADSSVYQAVQDILQHNSFLPSRVNFPCQLPSLGAIDMTEVFKSPSFSRNTNLEPALKPYVCARGYATECEA